MLKAKTFRLRATEPEIEDWTNAATAEGLSASAWARRALENAVSDAKVLSPEHQERLLALEYQLRRAGQNLNTLLRNAQAQALGRALTPVTEAELTEVSAGLKTVLDEVKKTLHGQRTRTPPKARTKKAKPPPEATPE